MSTIFYVGRTFLGGEDMESAPSLEVALDTVLRYAHPLSVFELDNETGRVTTLYDTEALQEEHDRREEEDEAAYVAQREVEATYRNLQGF